MVSCDAARFEVKTSDLMENVTARKCLEDNLKQMLSDSLRSHLMYKLGC